MKIEEKHPHRKAISKVRLVSLLNHDLSFAIDQTFCKSLPKTVFSARNASKKLLFKPTNYADTHVVGVWPLLLSFGSNRSSTSQEFLGASFLTLDKSGENQGVGYRDLLFSRFSLMCLLYFVIIVPLYNKSCFTL